MRMANGKEGAGYWLPSEFLTDDDFLMDKENFNNSESNELHADFCFPTEFPYDFQTQTDHLLRKFCAMSTSPQSTLSNLRSAGGSNNGSPSGAQSPPTTAMGAEYDAVGDLIYLAAGEVAKLKLSRCVAMNSCPPPRNLAQFHKEARISTPSVHLNTTTFENIGARAVRGIGQAAWAPHQIPAQGRAALSGGGGAAAKKVCAGTGVFLPRRYDNIGDSNAYSSGHCRRPGCSPSPFQGRATAQIHTKPLMHRFGDSQPQPPPKIGGAFVSDHDSVLAHRHALVLLQQRRSFSTPAAEGSSMISRDHPCLPQEWTY